MPDETGAESFGPRIERFVTFDGLTDQKAASAYAVLESLRGNESTQGIRPDIFEQLTNPKYTPTVSLLGAGNGAMEFKLLGAIAAMRLNRGGLGNMEIYCEDISPQSRDQFMSKIRAVPIDHHTQLILDQMGIAGGGGTESVDLSAWVREYNLSPFDDASYRIPDSDVVLLSHALYYLKNWKETNCEMPENLYDERFNPLLKMQKGIREKRGLAVSIHQHADSQMYMLRKEFNPKIHPGHTEVSGGDLFTALHELDIYTKGAKIPTFSLDVRSLFQSAGSFTFCPDDSGKALLSFIFRKDWDGIDPDLQSEIAISITKMVTDNRARAPRILLPGQEYQDMQLAAVPSRNNKALTHFLNMVDVMGVIDSKDFGKPVPEKFRN